MIAIGGHSCGAFMTANLLAHSDIFAAGIARSGAYNRTLTPFGFQAEERSVWEAPEIYFAMSPFMHADKVNEPILLIHGQLDNNSGTFPMQSERFFAALKKVTERLLACVCCHTRVMVIAVANRYSICFGSKSSGWRSMSARAIHLSAWVEKAVWGCMTFRRAT
jgi:hypothetical protein